MWRGNSMILRKPSSRSRLVGEALGECQRGPRRRSGQPSRRSPPPGRHVAQPCRRSAVRRSPEDAEPAVRSIRGRRTAVDDCLFPETDRWVEDLSGRRFAVARLARDERQAKQQCGCSHQRVTSGAGPGPGGEAMRNAAQNQASAMPGMPKVSMQRGRTWWCRRMENRVAQRRRSTRHQRMSSWSHRRSYTDALPLTPYRPDRTWVGC